MIKTKIDLSKCNIGDILTLGNVSMSGDGCQAIFLGKRESQDLQYWAAYPGVLLTFLEDGTSHPSDLYVDEVIPSGRPAMCIGQQRQSLLDSLNLELKPNKIAVSQPPIETNSGPVLVLVTTNGEPSGNRPGDFLDHSEDFKASDEAFMKTVREIVEKPPELIVKSVQCAVTGCVRLVRPGHTLCDHHGK